MLYATQQIYVRQYRSKLNAQVANMAPRKPRTPLCDNMGFAVSGRLRRIYNARHELGPAVGQQQWPWRATRHLPNQATRRASAHFPWGLGSKRQSAEDTRAAADDRCLAAPLQSLLLHQKFIASKPHRLPETVPVFELTRGSTLMSLFSDVAHPASGLLS